MFHATIEQVPAVCNCIHQLIFTEYGLLSVHMDVPNSKFVGFVTLLTVPESRTS